MHRIVVLAMLALVAGCAASPSPPMPTATVTVRVPSIVTETTVVTETVEVPEEDDDVPVRPVRVAFLAELERAGYVPRDSRGLHR